MKKTLWLLLSLFIVILPACNRAGNGSPSPSSETTTSPSSQAQSQLPPKISSVAPTGQDVAPSARIVLQFNEPMNSSTVEKIEVSQNGWNGGPTSGEAISGKWSTSDDKGFTFTPSQPFEPGSLVVIHPTTEVKSNGGAAYVPAKPIYSFLVDDGHHEGNKEIDIPSIKTTNNGTHTIPMIINIPNGDGPYPVMFWVHGGGWQGGTAAKSEVSIGNEADYLDDHLGIAVVSVAYRAMGSKGSFSEAMEDVADAITFIRQHAAEYHIDTKHMGFYGGSAGTPLAALTAQRTPEADLFVGYNGIYDFVHVKHGMFGSGNAYGQEVPSAEANSAIDHLRSNPPATLLLHGTKDTTIDPQQSVAFAKAIQAVGGQAKVLVYPGEEHGFFNKGKPMENPTLYEVKEFIKSIWHLK